MAIGDQQDIATRIRGVLPPWFGPSETETPVLTALLQAPAWALARVHELYVFAKLQTRIATSTGGWLDLSSYDYFGARLPRLAEERDVAFSLRIRREILRKRNTREAIESAVLDLTGFRPKVFEGFNSADTGGWGTWGLAFGRAGAWGDRNAPANVLVTTPLPQGYGIPNRGAWGAYLGGYGVGNFSWVGPEDIVGSGPTVVDVLEAIDRVRSAGVTIHVRFSEELYVPIGSPGNSGTGTGTSGADLDFSDDNSTTWIGTL